MAVAERLDSLQLIRDKVLAGERLDVDDGIVLMQSDDVLGSLSWPTQRAVCAAAQMTSTSSRTST